MAEAALPGDRDDDIVGDRQAGDQQEPECGSHPARPRQEAGDEPDDRYRQAARTLAAWRSDGTLHKDPHPSIYVYGQD